jgi:hypothetical protein
MYPQPELNLLAYRKRLLVARIRARREECAAQVHTVLKPAFWLEEMRGRWKAISPLTRLAAVPVGVMLVRKIMPKVGFLARWAPLATNLFRVLR